MKNKIKLDYAPKFKKPFDWQGMAIMVATVAAIVGVILIFVAFQYRIDWS